MCFDKKGRCKFVGIMGIMAIVVRNRNREGKRAVEDAVCPLSVAAETISAGLEAFLCHPSHSLWDQNVLSEPLLLKKFECSNGRAWVAGEGHMNISVTW
jgi:hypothetical protein